MDSEKHTIVLISENHIENHDLISRYIEKLQTKRAKMAAKEERQRAQQQGQSGSPLKNVTTGGDMANQCGNNLQNHCGNNQCADSSCAHIGGIPPPGASVANNVGTDTGHAKNRSSQITDREQNGTLILMLIHFCIWHLHLNEIRVHEND